MDHYILAPDGETPVPFDVGPNFEHMDEWSRTWIAQRHLAEDPFPCGGVVSTIFLGMDHNWGFGGPPVLFETMAFDAGGRDVFQHRETTKRRALKTHAQVLEHVMQQVGQ